MLIPVTNHSNVASRRGGEGGTGEENKCSTSSKKGKPTFTGDSTHPPICPDEPDETLPAREVADAPNQDVFADTPRAAHNKAESEGEEGTPVAALAAKKHCAVNPYHPSCCGTLLFSSMHHNYLKDLPPGNYTTQQRVATADLQEER